MHGEVVYYTPMSLKTLDLLVTRVAKRANLEASLSGNTSSNGGGIGGATVTLTNSTVSNNTARFGGDCGFQTVISSGYNLESPGDTCRFDQPNDQVNVSADDLKLGPLQDNGGPTMTHALGAGSVAIDVIPADMCEVDEDQRGEPRDSMCDVGAFGVQP